MQHGHISRRYATAFFAFVTLGLTSACADSIVAPANEAAAPAAFARAAVKKPDTPPVPKDTTTTVSPKWRTNFMLSGYMIVAGEFCPGSTVEAPDGSLWCFPDPNGFGGIGVNASLRGYMVASGLGKGKTPKDSAVVSDSKKRNDH